MTIYSNKSILNTIAITLLLVIMIGCTTNNNPSEHQEIEEEIELALTQNQITTIGIEYGTIENKNLNKIIKANGFTSVPPQNRATISSLIGGNISDIYVLEGTFVPKGKVLATLQNLEVIQIQEDYATANAQISFLEMEYNRQKTLSTDNITTQKNLQEVYSKLTIEKAKAYAAQSKLQMLNLKPGNKTLLIPIVSPIDGYIAKIDITKGEYVSPGKSVFEIIDNRQMHLDLNVYEKDLENIAIGQQIDFTLTNQSSKVIQGTIFGINKSFSNESKTVTVHAKINSKSAKELIPGMYISANINIENNLVMAVPKDAIVRDGDNYYIFAIEQHVATNNEHEKDETHFEAIPIVPGTTDLGYTQIKPLETLEKELQIVTKGSFYLLSKMKGGGGHHDH